MSVKIPGMLPCYFLSHNNPCFPCNIANRNFLVSHTCEVRFHDVIGQSTVHMYSYADLHVQMGMFWAFTFQFNSLVSVK